MIRSPQRDTEAGPKAVGMHHYNTSGVKDETPFSRVEDGALFMEGCREVCFVGAWWKASAVATLGGKATSGPSRGLS